MSPEEVTDIARGLISQAAGRSTPARESVLNILLSAPTALSHTNIKKTITERNLKIDRVTLYRTLDWLVEQGIAHRIASVNRTWYFSALAHIEQKPHAHFHCKKCELIYCLEEIPATPLDNLPSDYQLEEADLCLQGQCIRCSGTSEN